MYFYRIVGALLLGLSGFACAYTMNSSADISFKQLEGLIAFMRFIRIQIECFSLPASEIICRCDRELLTECGYGGDGAIKNFEELFDRISIKDEIVRKLMRDFSKGFGKGYREEQLKECDYYIDRLCEQRERVARDLPKRKKVNSTLCISSALALIILLI